MSELTECLSPEEFQSFIGKTFKVLKGPYAGKQGKLLGTMDSDNELALDTGDGIAAFPFIHEIAPMPLRKE